MYLFSVLLYLSGYMLNKAIIYQVPDFRKKLSLAWLKAKNMQFKKR